MNDEDQFNLETLSKDHKTALNEFKIRFEKYPQEYLKNDYFLLDWLIARKYDINAAEAMLKYHLKFRKALGQDSPSYKDYKPNSLAQSYYPHGCFGNDKQGRPIGYNTFGNIDPKGLICNVKTSELLSGLFWYLENWKWYCQDASVKYGKRIHQTVSIMDLNGLGMKHMWKPGIQMFQLISQMLQEHCPELVHKFYVINAPSMFPTIFRLIKPVLDINIQNKILILGDNYQQVLLEDIDADQLPVAYGGTAKDSHGDPTCSEFICYGGEVPLDMYYKRLDTSKENLTEITVASGKQMLIACKVTKPGSVISWYFEFDPYYETYDIGFAMYKKLSDEPSRVEDMEMTVPHFRVFCGFVPESGEFVAKEIGTYVIQFDNTYSWINGKTLKYRIQIDGELVK